MCGYLLKKTLKWANDAGQISTPATVTPSSCYSAELDEERVHVVNSVEVSGTGQLWEIQVRSTPESIPNMLSLQHNAQREYIMDRAINFVLSLNIRNNPLLSSVRELRHSQICPKYIKSPIYLLKLQVFLDSFVISGRDCIEESTLAQSGSWHGDVCINGIRAPARRNEVSNDPKERSAS